MQLTRRFSHGLLVTVNYTWSHGLTDAQVDRNLAPQNTYNIPAEYGPSELDRRQIFAASFVYNLPWFQSAHGFRGHVLGGWEVSGIVSAATGTPLTVTTTGIDTAGIT